MKLFSIFLLLFIPLIGFYPFKQAQDQPEGNTTAVLPPDSIAYSGTMQEKTDLLRFRSGHQNMYHYAPADSFIYLYSEVTAPKIEVAGERTPLNISLVIDRSGSMMGDKIRYVKEAAKFVVNNISANDILSIVVYSTDVQVLYPAQKVSDKNHVLNLIDQLNVTNSTNLSGGMFEGYAQVEKNLSGDYVNRVLLLSDGLANIGIIDSASLVKAAADKLEQKGISLSSFGVGVDFNENLMMSLAEYGGNYYFIGSPDQVPAIFAKELNGLLTVAAQNLTLTIDLPAGVKLDRVFGYRCKQTGQRVEIPFQDIFSEEKKAVLLRCKVDRQSHGPYLFKETLDFIGTDATKRTIVLETKLESTEDQLVYNQHYVQDVLQQIVIFESNEIMEVAMREMDGRNFNGARRVMEDGQGTYGKYAELAPPSEEMELQDSLYRTYKQNIDSAENMKEEEYKYYQKDNKQKNYDVRKKK